MYDVTVIGAGLAGLQVARLAARGGASVLLVDARRTITDCVRTTGIFVRRTFEDFPALDPFLGRPIRAIGLHSPSGQAIELVSDRDEFRVGRMKPLYEAMLGQAIAAGVTWRPSTTYASLQPRGDHSEILFRDGTAVQTRFVVAADGARSRVARDLHLDRNSEWITGVECVFPSKSIGTPRFDCWIDPRIAPGYLAWIVDDGEEMHVGVGGNRDRFDSRSALDAFETRLREEGRLAAATPIERRGGLIPVNGVLRRIEGGPLQSVACAKILKCSVILALRVEKFAQLKIEIHLIGDWQIWYPQHPAQCTQGAIGLAQVSCDIGVSNRQVRVDDTLFNVQRQEIAGRLSLAHGIEQTSLPRDRINETRPQLLGVLEMPQCLVVVSP